MTTRSTAKERLELVAMTWPEPTVNTMAVCTRVYMEFMPSKHGVTMRLLMMDWKMMEALPMEKAAISITTKVGNRRERM